VAPDAISAHDVSLKILRRFRAEHSCPHLKIFKKGVLCAMLLLGSLAHLVSRENALLILASKRAKLPIVVQLRSFGIMWKKQFKKLPN